MQCRSTRASVRGTTSSRPTPASLPRRRARAATRRRSSRGRRARLQRAPARRGRSAPRPVRPCAALRCASARPSTSARRARREARWRGSRRARRRAASRWPRSRSSGAWRRSSTSRMRPRRCRLRTRDRPRRRRGRRARTPRVRGARAPRSWRHGCAGAPGRAGAALRLRPRSRPSAATASSAPGRPRKRNAARAYRLSPRAASSALARLFPTVARPAVRASRFLARPSARE